MSQMPDALDMDLVREFARNHSETAFTELVRRHLPLVYSVARRCIGNDGDAQDVAQAVFIILARKAAALHQDTVLPGWLYETTRFTAARLVRANIRRRAREQEAYMQSNLNESESTGAWEQLVPHLESAMAGLKERDRALLVLRFYQNKTGVEAATLMGMRENTLHKRAARALDKLRTILAKRGVTLSGEAVAGAILSNSIQAVPVGLEKTISAAALAHAAAASTSTLTLVKGALKVMAWTNAKTAIAVGVGILLVAATPVTITQIRQATAWPRIARAVKSKNFQLLQHAPPMVAIRSSKFYPAIDSGFIQGQNGEMVGLAIPAAGVFGHAFHIVRDRIINQDLLPTDRYDFVTLTPNHPSRALQAAAQKMFGVIATPDTIETNILVLTQEYPYASKLKQSKPSGNWYDPVWMPGYAKYVNMPMSFFAFTIERRLNVPIIDDTGLTNRYDILLRWNQQTNNPDPQTLKQALFDQLGLKLTPESESLDVLVLEKAR